MRQERRRAEESLRKTEERISKIIERSLAGYFYVDHNMVFRDVNQAWLRMHGYSSPDQVIGGPFNLAFPGTEDKTKTAAADLLCGNSISSDEFPRLCKDGSIGFNTISLSPVLHYDKIIGWEGFLIDTTEKRRLYEKQNILLHDVKERIKELHFLYEVTHLLVDRDRSMAEIFQNVVDLIPAAFQFPDSTCARIRFEDRELITPNFQESGWRLAADIMVSGTHTGLVEVYYLVAKPEDAEGPFVAEERNLMNALAKQLGQSVERRRADERIEHLNRVLRAIRNVNQLITKEKDRDRLIQKACQILIATRGYHHAWIVLLNESGQVLKTAASGEGDTFLQFVEKMEQGILPAYGQRALQKSEIEFTPDTSSDCPDYPLAKDQAGQGGFTGRLANEGKVFGLLHVSLPQNIMHDVAEQSIFKEVMGDIAFGLHNIEREEIRNQAVVALQQSEEKFRAIFEGANDGILAAEPHTKKFVFANPRMCEITGYSLPELLVLDVPAIHPAEDLPSVMDQVSRQVQGEITLASDIPVLTKKRSIVYCDVNSQIVTIGNEQYLVGFFRDITERRLLEQDLREREERFRTFFDNAPIGKCITAPDGKLLRVNHALCRMLGYSPEELMNISIPSLTHPDDLEMTMAGIRSLHKGESDTFTVEKRYVHKDGRSIWTNMSVSLLRDEEGRPVHFLTHVMDLTEIQRLARELQQSNVELKQERALLEQRVTERTLDLSISNAELARATRLKDEFLASMSHELRTPLNAILGLSESLDEKVYGPVNDRQSKALHRIDMAGQHLLSLINDILDVSKIEAGKLKLDFSAVNIANNSANDMVK
ncbi:PAS domain S-box protein [candidate division CSSED10-310 bacterium]|uniref:histidine kinase n=1 Tax=candidate division CSSED10-310 bacterium TaxID=2855610 RepID=A0ABV6Z696_UNCC1